MLELRLEPLSAFVRLVERVPVWTCADWPVRLTVAEVETVTVPAEELNACPDTALLIALAKVPAAKAIETPESVTE
jgi:hypothetical protein